VSGPTWLASYAPRRHWLSRPTGASPETQVWGLNCICRPAGAGSTSLATSSASGCQPPGSRASSRRSRTGRAAGRAWRLWQEAAPTGCAPISSRRCAAWNGAGWSRSLGAGPGGAGATGVAPAVTSRCLAGSPDDDRDRRHQRPARPARGSPARRRAVRRRGRTGTAPHTARVGPAAATRARRPAELGRPGQRQALGVDGALSAYTRRGTKRRRPRRAHASSSATSRGLPARPGGTPRCAARLRVLCAHQG